MRLQHLVCDVEGTLALDGRFRNELFRTLTALQDRLDIHLITADVYRQQDAIDQRLNLKAVRLDTAGQISEREQKRKFVEGLGAEHVVAIGQGADDAGMLAEAALGICVLSREGVAVETLLAADLVLNGIVPALELLTTPLRIVNTLRS